MKGAQKIERMFVANVAGKIKVEIELEVFAGDGTRLDFCEVQSGGGETSQHAGKRSRAVGKRKADADFVRVGRQEHFPADHEEPRAVDGSVLNILREDVQPAYDSLQIMRNDYNFWKCEMFIQYANLHKMIFMVIIT